MNILTRNWNSLCRSGTRKQNSCRNAHMHAWDLKCNCWYLKNLHIYELLYFKCNENKIPMPLTKGDYVDAQKAGYFGIRMYARRKTKATIYMFSWMNCVGGFFIFAPTSNNYNFISFACHGRKWNTCVTFTFWFWRHRVLQRSWQAELVSL